MPGAVEVDLFERPHDLVPETLPTSTPRCTLPEFSQKSAATSTATMAQTMITGPAIPRRRLLSLPESRGFKLDG
jgi:hypothetical protein